MTDRRDDLVGVGVASLAVAIAIRAATLYWSPLPATLDGFGYAGLARTVVETGQIPFTQLAADQLVFTLVLALASAVTGVEPLYLAQPLIACLGGASVLAVIALALRVTPDTWDATSRRYVAGTVGMTFAIEGLYLRRSGVPDEEAIGLLLLPLFAIAVHQSFERRAWSWVVVAGLLALIYPPLHNLSSIVAALTVTALAASDLVRTPSKRTAVVGAGATIGMWTYVFGFYWVAAQFGFELTYSGMLREYPGAFLAWVVLLVVLVAWLQTTTDRTRRVVAALALLPLFVVVGVNLGVPVFPGTLETPPVVFALVVPFLVPAGLFVWGVPRLSTRDGPLVGALAAGPLTMVWFTLTTALLPQFFDAVMRAQTFAHHAVFALAGVTAVGMFRRRPWLGRVAIAALVVAAVVSVPLGFVHLDTGTAPRTVHTSEFEAASFAALHTRQFASDHRLSRIGWLYYQAERGGDISAVRAWLRGGPPPGCPTLAQRTWTTSGAHFYPAGPETISPARYDTWVARNNRVYAVGGTTTTVLIVPRAGSGSC